MYPVSHSCQVFLDAAQPPPLKSAWSSIVKQQPKGKEPSGQASAPLQPAKQSTPASPSKGAGLTSSSSQGQPLPSYAHLKVNPLPNGKQVSPRATDKGSSSPPMPNGVVSPHSSGESSAPPAADSQHAKDEPAEKLSQSSTAPTAAPQVRGWSEPKMQSSSSLLAGSYHVVPFSRLSCSPAASFVLYLTGDLASLSSYVCDSSFSGEEGSSTRCLAAA